MTHRQEDSDLRIVDVRMTNGFKHNGWLGRSPLNDSGRVKVDRDDVIEVSKE